MVEVGNDGSATVTFPDDQQQLLQAIRLLSEADSKGVRANPPLRHSVQNTSAF